MARRIRSSLLWSMFLLLAACTEPTGPAETLRPQFGAVVATGTGVFTFAGTVYFECAGEVVYATANAPYDYKIVSTPSGVQHYIERWRTEEVTGIMIGQTTGTVWHRARNIAPFMVHTTAKGTTTHYTFVGEWVSDNGPDLKIVERFFLRVDENGQVTKQTFELGCH